jgi:hypothetical protein
MKMFRIVRVLRLIGKDEGLQIGIQSLLRAIPNVIRIVAIMFMFLLVFGIVLVSFFKGTYFSCLTTTPSATINQFSSLTIAHKWDCLNVGGEW